MAREGAGQPRRGDPQAQRRPGRALGATLAQACRRQAEQSARSTSEGEPACRAAPAASRRPRAADRSRAGAGGRPTGGGSAREPSWPFAGARWKTRPQSCRIAGRRRRRSSASAVEQARRAFAAAGGGALTMCNTYRNRITLQAYREAFADPQTPTGAPNLEPRDSIRITEPAPIIRLDGEGRARTRAGALELARAGRQAGSTTSAPKAGASPRAAA